MTCVLWLAYGGDNSNVFSVEEPFAFFSRLSPLSAAHTGGHVYFFIAEACARVFVPATMGSHALCH